MLSYSCLKAKYLYILPFSDWRGFPCAATSYEYSPPYLGAVISVYYADGLGNDDRVDNSVYNAAYNVYVNCPIPLSVFVSASSSHSVNGVIVATENSDFSA